MDSSGFSFFPALEKLFGNRAAAAALVHLHEFSEAHARQIAQRFGCTTLQVQKQLDKLEELGLLVSRVQGQRFYSFAPERPLVTHLRAFLKSLGAEQARAAVLGPLFEQAILHAKAPSNSSQGEAPGLTTERPRSKASRRPPLIHEMDLGFVNMLTPSQRLDRAIDVLSDLFVLLRNEPGHSRTIEPLIQDLLQATMIFAEALGPIQPEWSEKLGQDLYQSIVGDAAPADLEYWKNTPFWIYFRCRFQLRADLEDLPVLRSVCEDLLELARDLSRGPLPKGSRSWGARVPARQLQH